MVSQLFPPTGYENLPLFLKVMGETIAMAFLGTLLGAVFAFPLSFLASRNITRSRPLQFGTRRFADLLRSFDYLIWALIFVRAIGLGPLAGIMAIAIVETGTFIKLYSEAIENLDRKQIDGVTAAGGNWLHRIWLRRSAAGAADDAVEHALHVRAQRPIGVDPRASSAPAASASCWRTGCAPTSCRKRA